MIELKNLSSAENTKIELLELVEKVDKDLPTNRFTINDKDEMVILGRMNLIVERLNLFNSDIQSLQTDIENKVRTAGAIPQNMKSNQYLFLED